jgi:glycosyltransferase involved in cell wall biosynthesis
MGGLKECFVKGLSVSVVVPVYNEEQNLEQVVRDLSVQLVEHDYEIIIVDDGSADGTSPLADQLVTLDPQHLRVIHHPTNLGGGAATRTGLFAAQRTFVMMVPGDGQFMTADIPRFLEAIQDVDMVISRRRNRSGGMLRKLNSWCYRMVVRYLLGIRYRHINWVKLYRRELVQSLKLMANSWLLDTEILYWAGRLDWRSTEIQVEELPRHAGKPTGNNPLHMLAVVRELWCFRKVLKQQQISPHAQRNVENVEAEKLV